MTRASLAPPPRVRAPRDCDTLSPDRAGYPSSARAAMLSMTESGNRARLGEDRHLAEAAAKKLPQESGPLDLES